MNRESTMDPKTLKALKASIAHWKRMAKHGIKGKDQPFSEECALCHEFLDPKAPYYDFCHGCPVRKKTGSEFCDGTPYSLAREAFEFTERTGKDNAHFKVAAGKMVKFLESVPTAAKKPRK